MEVDAAYKQSVSLARAYEKPWTMLNQSVMNSWLMIGHDMTHEPDEPYHSFLLVGQWLEDESTFRLIGDVLDEESDTYCLSLQTIWITVLLIRHINSRSNI